MISNVNRPCVGTTRKALEKHGLPHGCAIKVHHKPFRRIESYAVGIFNAGHKGPKFRTDKGRARIGRIHMQPHLFFFANRAQFGKFVERTGSSSTQSSAKLKC